MTNDRIEQLILRGIATNDVYARKVIPFLKATYFENPAEVILYKKITELFIKYNAMLSKEVILVSINSDKGIPENLFPVVKEMVENLDPITNVNDEWLVDNTEQFCKDRAIYNAILKSIEIMDGVDKKHNKDILPTLLSEALSVNFDHSIGHDYFEDSVKRFDFYHKLEERVPFKLASLNDVTKGGVPNKTLNIIMAGTNVGKSAFMCDWAAFCVMAGYNVLYVTAEMAEMRIGERLDANLLDVCLNDLDTLDKTIFDSRLAKLQEKTNGKLIVKEYPTATANAGHIGALLDELKIKRNFKPHILFVDYLNIFCSQRYKLGTDSYTTVKAIAEELRGLAMVYDIPVISATQVNRAGYSNSDMDLDDTSESWGLPSTADFFIALIATDELTLLNQQMVKQLKSRYGNPNNKKRFVIGVDMDKQRYYDVNDKAQLTGVSAVMIAEKNKATNTIVSGFFKKPERKQRNKNVQGLAGLKV